ncbi:MAG TPA: hypothetical protein VLE99_05385 [Candidatus Saccharimonadales bacterium]|nr:hypothetical protein [Candidatus Saccharimonadales bacterium]
MTDRPPSTAAQQLADQYPDLSVRLDRIGSTLMVTRQRVGGRPGMWARLIGIKLPGLRIVSGLLPWDSQPRTILEMPATPRGFRDITIVEEPLAGGVEGDEAIRMAREGTEMFTGYLALLAANRDVLREIKLANLAERMSGGVHLVYPAPPTRLPSVTPVGDHPNVVEIAKTIFLGE